MMSTNIHLHYHSLYDVCGIESMPRIVGISICHSHSVCVPIHASVISSTHITHRYLDIYVNILFAFSQTI